MDDHPGDGRSPRSSGRWPGAVFLDHTAARVPAAAHGTAVSRAAFTSSACPALAGAANAADSAARGRAADDAAARGAVTHGGALDLSTSRFCRGIPRDDAGRVA